MTGPVYRGGPAAVRHERRQSAERAGWQAIAVGIGIVAVLSTGIGIAVLYVAPLDHGWLGMGLAGIGMVLLAVASWAWLNGEPDELPLIRPTRFIEGQTVDLLSVLAEESRRNLKFRASVNAAARRYQRRHL